MTDVSGFGLAGVTFSDGWLMFKEIQQSFDFGLSGHLKEMLQNSGLSAIIETVPSIKLSKILSEEYG